jgi:hypothetical protein
MYHAIPPAKTIAATVSSSESAPLAVAVSAIITVVDALRPLYALSVIGSRRTTPVWPSFIEVVVTFGLLSGPLLSEHLQK